MAKTKYKLNPQTLTYEVIATPFRLRFYRLLRKLLIGFLLACLVNFVFSYFFYTPKMSHIIRDNEELIMQYRILQSKIAASQRQMQQIKQRDNNVYRLLFAADTLDIAGVYDPYPEQKYESFSSDYYGGLIVDTWSSLDDLTKMVYLQSRSLDQLQELSLDKEKMAYAIPAIWPIDRRVLRGNIGAYGGRNHPILGRYLMHTGIDLAANKGTPVYATGNGVVEKDTGGGTGYGKQIILNHGFGYKTRYAHLDKIDVEVGQTVLRGEKIGEVGNTGRSTAPHLHYEVIYLGHHVNPVNYFRKDMSEEDFEQIIQSAQATIYEAFD